KRLKYGRKKGKCLSTRRQLKLIIAKLKLPTQPAAEQCVADDDDKLMLAPGEFDCGKRLFSTNLMSLTHRSCFDLAANLITACVETCGTCRKSSHISCSHLAKCSSDNSDTKRHALKFNSTRLAMAVDDVPICATPASFRYPNANDRAKRKRSGLKRTITFRFFCVFTSITSSIRRDPTHKRTSFTVNSFGSGIRIPKPVFSRNNNVASEICVTKLRNCWQLNRFLIMGKIFKTHSFILQQVHLSPKGSGFSDHLEAIEFFQATTLTSYGNPSALKILRKLNHFESYY
uniref:Uncharacterized protein n=1 Tax=Glossina palpalis gambiensis TaxID=67801 RepID=A0A1B0C4L0_9MUSC